MSSIHLESLSPLAHEQEVGREKERPLFDARRAVERYSEHADDRDDIVPHAERTASLVRAFAGNVMPEEAILLSYVHDVFDRYWNIESSKHTLKRSGVARAVLLDMLTEEGFSSEQIDYALCILYDMVRSEQSSGYHRKKMAEEGGNNETVLRMLSDEYKGDIPAEIWKRTEPYIDFVHMYDFLKMVNIEALIIKASELVDNMRHPSSRRESALLQDVLEAESFYAPILEVLGFDGLASAIRGEAYRMRLEKQGIGHTVERARTKLEGIERRGIDSIAQSVFGKWKTGEYSHSVGVDEATNSTPVIVGDGEIYNSNGVATVKFRIKTAGSLASKYERYGDIDPADIVGFTVISEGIEESARNFADFIADRMMEEDSLRETIAYSKEKPYFIEGPAEFVAAVSGALEARGLDAELIAQCKVQTPEDIQREGHRKLQVAKVTLMAEGDVPVEIQFLTRQERESARVGEVAHIIYKYLRSHGETMTADEKRRMVTAAVTVMREMHRRRLNLNRDHIGVNASSVGGGKEVGVDLAGDTDALV